MRLGLAIEMAEARDMTSALVGFYMGKLRLACQTLFKRIVSEYMFKVLIRGYFILHVSVLLCMSKTLNDPVSL